MQVRLAVFCDDSFAGILLVEKISISVVANGLFDNICNSVVFDNFIHLLIQPN